ncbi:MAG: hypothetical protein A3G80_10510 [Betaproteobacteria bacterium RIFCSPLOWO2_12_FULL_62_13b]|nr:MAG: hypothetical protein A3G80_10510 [Betaproteobacteria bacterium RIFCSPLOWO2_12_FULL_62_13b]
MNVIDRALQRRRIAKAKPYIPHGASVLDVGCGDGALFKQLKGQIGRGVGIDPALASSERTDSRWLISGRFPADVPDAGPYDVITMLAVVEHLSAEEQRRLAAACARLLKPGGCLIITVPSRLVDPLLRLLKFMRVLDGMCLDDHHGFEARETPSLFCGGGLELVKHEIFQLGLNNLFVFQRPVGSI